jgi:ABC-2 type transport system permease protein
LVVGAFNQEQVSRYFEVLETDRPEAQALIAADRLAGAIVIPEGFSRAILDQAPTHLEVIKNPARSIGPVAVEETAAMIAQLLDGAVTVLSGPLDQLSGLIDETEAKENRWEAFPTDIRVADLAGAFNRSLRDVQRFAFPPVITVERQEAGALDESEEVQDADQAGPSQTALIFRYVLPGMATFALMLLALGFVADIPRERTLGTLARQLVAPVHAGAVLAGKLLSAVGMGLIITLAMAAVGYFLLDVRADLAAFLLISIAFVAAATGLFAIFYGIARNERTGGTLASIVVMVMAILGGSWFSLDNAPAFMRALSPLTLNYWGIRGLRAIVSSDAGVREVGLPIGVLFAVAVAGTLLGSYLMRRRLMQGV